MTYPSFFRAFIIGAACFCLSLLAANAEEKAVPGAQPNFEKLTKSFAKENPDKIEVVEFFSYGCGHCNDFHPIISKWASALPADVHFRRIPVGWNRQWSNLSRLYYTLEFLGELKRLDGAVFAAIHRERRNDLILEKGASRWYAGQGGNEQKFLEAYNSFGVMSKVKQADALAMDIGIDGVPTLVVEGQYKVSPDEFAQMLKIADQLIVQARTRARKK